MTVQVASLHHLSSLHVSSSSIVVLCSQETSSIHSNFSSAPPFSPPPCLLRLPFTAREFDLNFPRLRFPSSSSSSAVAAGLGIRVRTGALAYDASSAAKLCEDNSFDSSNIEHNYNIGELPCSESKELFENKDEAEKQVDARLICSKVEDGNRLYDGYDGETSPVIGNNDSNDSELLSFRAQGYESVKEGEKWENADIVAESQSELLSERAKEDGERSDGDEEDGPVSFEEEINVLSQGLKVSTKDAVEREVESNDRAEICRGKPLTPRLAATGDEADRVNEFFTKVRTQNDYVITTEDLASIYDFPLDKFQFLAIEGFLRGSSVVVCAPTSSGKTLVAEVAAVATLARGRRLFYTTPLKALSNQKLREFRTLFGEENVGLLTGDAAVNKEAPILIMTTEILRNMLYQSVGNKDEADSLRSVDTVVLDEIHYLSDITRGTTWEETIIYCPKKVQLICLSATIANPEELSGWIAQVHGPTELVVSSRRPVPLLWHFSTRHYILPLLSKKATEINRELLFRRNNADLEVDPFSNWLEGNGKGKKNLSRNEFGKKKGHSVEIPELSEEQMQFIRRKQVPQIRDTLRQLQARDMLPAIWFIFSRRGCDTAVHYQQELQLLSQEERKEVRFALRQFRTHHPEAVRESAVSFLFRGVASHHAGCLPLWKSFIEELFQRGLVKVIFATETLAAGINMPARTTVLSALSKKADKGLKLLSANSMLQMAGRAGRRGIDSQGHVVVVQTPFEGAEECCKLLFAGADPLVSQFTATYGMALNLLAGTRFLNTDDPTSESFVRRRRTLEEARALIEQSFGNYLNREVGVKAKEKIARLHLDVQKLESEESGVDELVLLEEKIGQEKFKEYGDLRKLFQEAENVVAKQKKRIEEIEAAIMYARLEELIKEQSSYICISYVDCLTDEECLLPAICVDRISDTKSILHRSSAQGNTTSESYPKPWEQELVIGENETIADFPQSESFDERVQSIPDYNHYVALGTDNKWYLFTARSVKSICRIIASEDQEHLAAKTSRVILKDKLWLKFRSWRKVGSPGIDAQASVWYSEGSLETMPFSKDIPSLSELIEEIQVSEELFAVQKMLVKAKKLFAKRKQKFEESEGYKMFNLLSDLKNMRGQKIARKKAKILRMEQRIKQMQPSGWKEFLQVLQVLQTAGAIDPGSNELLPLGVSALAIRGTNELWLALALSSENLNALKPAELAAICGTLVGEGTKVRPESESSIIYEPSNVVTSWIKSIEPKRKWLLELQTQNGVEFPCELDPQFSGLVEAWALGVNWKELMMDCGMDEGDVARLLRRSIDLLLQIPFLPRISPILAKTSRLAAEIMDRPPISELVA